MNELQIKITGDIANLQSALTKAKATLKEFSSQSESSGAKLSNSYKRATGVIGGLQQKIKQLRSNLESATDVKSIVKYNLRLEETQKELTRVQALGRTLGSTATSTANGFNKLAQSQGNANGVAIEFNRIIQDAPFGLIGIGNNIQQLTANFAQVSAKAGGAGAAIKASLSALISPANLLVLGISAVTAAFTAYQMGAFDSLFATEDLAKSAEEAAEKLEEYRNTLDAVSRANIEGAANAEKEIQSFELLKSQAENANIPLEDRIEAVKDLQSKYPDYLGNLTEEQILTGNVGDSYQNLSNQIIATAKARAASDAIAENSLKLLTLEAQLNENIEEQKRLALITSQKAVNISGSGATVITEQQKAEQKIAELKELQLGILEQILPIKEDDKRLTEEINKQISEGARFTESTKKETESLIEALSSQEEKLGLISGLTEEINNLKKERDLAKDQEEINLITGRIDLLKEELDLINIKSKRANTPVDLGIDTSGLPKRDGNIDITNPATAEGIIPSLNPDLFLEEAQKVIDTNNVLIDSFGSLGNQVANSFGIANDNLRAFVSTVLSNAPKIIQAVIKQAAANKTASAVSNQANAQQAAGNVVVSATAAAKGLGPVGLAVLPVLIGGALALISGIFGKIGGGGGVPSGAGGGGGSAGAPPQTFTNAQIPNQTTPQGFGGSIDQSNAQGKLSVDIEYDKLRFFLDEGDRRRDNG